MWILRHGTALAAGLVLSGLANGQHLDAADAADGAHAHDLHRPAYHADEIGVGFAPVFNADGHGDPGTAVHAHYVHHLGVTHWGVGADYEHIFSDHENATLSALLQWSPHPYTHLVVAPGICSANGMSDWNPSLHLEAFQDFHWHGMAIGPFVEWAFETGTQQYEMGFHLGVPIGHADPRYPEPHRHHPLVHHRQRREARH